VDEIALPEGFYDLGGGASGPDSLYDWGRRAVPLFQLYLGICLTTEESTENLRQGVC
jgi:hypothetical protein